MHHTRRPPVSGAHTSSKAGLHLPAGLPAEVRGSRGAEGLDSWASSLKQHGSIHSSMRKFRERDEISDTDVMNTFFPTEPYSLGCRPVGWFGTERAPRVAGPD